MSLHRYLLQQPADRFGLLLCVHCTGGLLSERSVDVRLTGRGDMQRSAGRDKDSRVGLSTGLTDWRINLQYARRAGLLARCASLHCDLPVCFALSQCASANFGEGTPNIICVPRISSEITQHLVV